MGCPVKSLYPGQVLSVSAPALTFIAQYDGRLVEPTVLGFQIFDVTTDVKLGVPLQVYPVSGVQAVDTTGAALGLGRYAATWTVPSDAALGRYRIKWTFQVPSAYVTTPSPPPWVGTSEETFEVLATKCATDAAPQYCLLADIRDEGICDVSGIPDARLQLTIRRVSRAIEQITGRFFEPRYMNVRSTLGTTSTHALLFDMPIVGIERIDSPYFYDYWGIDVDLDMLRIANRHLTGVCSPDDRENPKIELVHMDEDYGGIRFTRYYDGLAFVRNITAIGVFGYTEADGSPAGQTPLAIQHATKLIVARELPKIGQRDKREDAQQRWRITSERSRDMAINTQAPRGFGQWYGDPEIDSILVQFIRPPQMGAA